MDNKLPALAFGGRAARLDKCPYDMGDQLRSVVKGLKAYESIEKPAHFLSHSSSLNINGLQLVANSSKPVQYKVDSADDGNIVILLPFFGEGSATMDKRIIRYHTGKTAALLPEQSVFGTSSTRSLLMANINASRLQQTAQGMLGLSEGMPFNMDLNSPREINLHFGAVSFDALIRQHANIIDQFVLMPHMLNMMAMDEYFYSILAMMLAPALFLGTTSLLADIRYDKRLLDRTCQYIQANLTQPINLSMLDQVSNMSRRKLHYAFLHRYDCTPMQWVRQERLNLVHNQLKSSQHSDTVTKIAIACGFTKMSTFAQFYKESYGELPSTTLSRMRS